MRMASRSLSSWRAWIEISILLLDALSSKSLSSWRAWIEICGVVSVNGACPVALLMESVD